MNVFVFDANTVVSAALHPDRTARAALILARSSGMIALSSDVHAEIAAVLSRRRFASAIGEDRRREILELLSAAALWVRPDRPVGLCRDAKDNKYLELADAAGAAAIVSGDQDLLVLDPFINLAGRAIAILNPAGFMARFPPSE